jgi:peptide-methionine (S)-S-oxide reductase
MMMRFAVNLRGFVLPVLMAAFIVGCGRTDTTAATPVTPIVDSKPPAGTEQATFAAGCFWSMEAIFKQLKGVAKVEPGYAGGHTANPSYEDVETGTTGHAESINVAFDPKVISYRDLLRVLLTVRNPTTPNRQGNDEGPEYRFIIFYRNAAQKAAATEMIRKIKDSHIWPDPIVAAVSPYTNFYRAEAYHFDYYHHHPNEPYCAGVIAPEIAEFQAKFKSMLK